MSNYTDLLRSLENQNWAKCAVAVSITSEGLRDLVKKEIEVFRDNILTNVRQPSAFTCNSCSTSDVLECPTNTVCKKYQGKCTFHTYPPSQCKNNICNKIRDEIIKEHLFGKPSWKNTDATKWCSDEWEIAKCYFPPNGYEDKHTAEETDFNGLISCIINCTLFKNHFRSLTLCPHLHCVCKSQQVKTSNCICESIIYKVGIFFKLFRLTKLLVMITFRCNKQMGLLSKTCNYHR